MKAKKILPALVLGVILLSGCAQKTRQKSNLNVTKIQEKINSNVRSNHFDRALGLSEALEVYTDTQKNKNQTKQVANLASANRSFSKFNFSESLTYIRKADNLNAKVNNHVINNAITKLKYKIQRVKKTTSGLRVNYSTARESLKSGKAAEAMASVNLILQSKYDKPAYNLIYTKALKLKIKILASQLDSKSGPTTSSKSTSQNQESSSSTTDNKESNSSSESNAVITNSITENDINSARADLKAAGENPDYWSDSDIETAITNARRSGRTHIRATDLH